MFEANLMWLVKSLVRKTDIIKNSNITKKWATKSKQERYKLMRKGFWSFCFPCSFTIHVNSKLMRTIFYSHNKFTNYLFHNSPDILARLINLAWKERQLKEIGWVHSFLRIPLNTAESGGAEVQILVTRFQFKSQWTKYSWHRHAILHVLESRFQWSVKIPNQWRFLLLIWILICNTTR